MGSSRATSRQLATLCPVPVLTVLFVSFVVQVTSGHAWQEDLAPRILLKELSESDGLLVFEGNTTDVDHFRLALIVDNHLLIGGRNALYNISLADFQERQRIDWYPDEDSYALCGVKGKSQSDCQNYIRVLTPDAHGYFICGTNAFKPRCRTYTHEDGALVMKTEANGIITCPYDPHLNTTTIIENGLVYSAGYADFQASDPLIFRSPLRTRQYDLKHFNAPDFVGSVSQGDFVFFFFREMAVEHTNCGKVIFSRVARVCKNDISEDRSNRWTTFLKARLNCSIPGDFPFYFNEIQSTTDFVEGVYASRKEKLIYAAFSTPPNSISASAVCAFSLQGILNAFEGPFKKQEGGSSWMPDKGPEPRPGRCSSGNRTGEMQRMADIAYIESNPLMDEAVQPIFGWPVLLRTQMYGRDRFSQVAVDPQVRAADGSTYDVVFVGTEDGWVIKAVNAESASQRPSENLGSRSIIIEEIRVIEDGSPIRNLLVSNDKIIVVGDGVVKTLPLHRCQNPKIESCWDCVGLQDPYCAWDREIRKCVRYEAAADDGKNARFAQSILTGHSDVCGPPRGNWKKKQRNLEVGDSSALPVATDDKDSSSPPSAPHTPITIGGAPSNEEILQSSVGYGMTSALYTMETLAVTVTGTGVGALLLGFLLGYFLGRKAMRCNKDLTGDGNRGDGCVSAEYEFLEQRPLPTPHRFATQPVYAASPDAKSLLMSRVVCSGSGLPAGTVEHTYYSQRSPAALACDDACGSASGSCHYAAPTLPYVDLVASSSSGGLGGHGASTPSHHHHHLAAVATSCGASGCSPYSSSAVAMSGRQTAGRRPRNLGPDLDGDGRASLRKMYL